MHTLRVGSQATLLFACSVVAVGITKLINLHTLGFVVNIEFNHLQQTKQQGLTHNAEVGTQGVHNLHAVVGGEELRALVVATFRERVVHHLGKATGRKHIAHHIAQAVGVGFLLVGESGVNVGGNLHVVVAVDAENLLNQVGRPLYVNPIRRNLHAQAVLILGSDIDFEAVKNVFDGLVANLLTNKVVDIVESDVNLEGGHGLGADVYNLRGNLATCQLLNEESCTFECIGGDVGIDTPLEAERGVGRKAVTFCGLTHPHGVEIGTLEEHVGGALAHTRVLATEHTCDTHRLLAVANHQVCLRQGALHTIKGTELSACGAGANNHLVTLNFVCIERVEGLAELVEHKVGNVHHVVLGVDTNSPQGILQPLGRGSNLHARDVNAGIPGSSLVVLNGHLGSPRGVVHLELLNAGKVEGSLAALRAQVGSQVACYAIVGSSVDTVGSKADSQQVVVLQAEVLHCGGAGDCILVELHNTLVAATDTKLILGTQHTERLNTTNLATFDFEHLVATGGVQLCANSGTHNLQTLAAVGSATDNIEGLAGAHIHGGDVEVVRIGVILAGENLTNNHTTKTALYCFDFLEVLNFQTDVGENYRCLLGCNVAFQIVFKPIIRNVHS